MDILISLLLGERNNGNDKSITLFFGNEELASRSTEGWVRNIKKHPNFPNTSIILCEEEILKLDVEKMKFNNIGRFDAKIIGYPITFEIGPVAEEQLKNYLEFIMENTKLVKNLANILIRFL